MTDHGIRIPKEVRIIDKYKLGVVDNPLPGDERFTGMLCIPYLTAHGVKAIRYRNLNGSSPKFAQHSGQQARLYNTLAYFRADELIGLAEGEIDAIVASEYLGIPTIGIPGAEMWTAHREIWTPIFKDFSRVLIFRDGDDAGQRLADAVTVSLKWRAQVIDPPAGEDISSMVAANRGAELLAKIGDRSDGDDG